MQGVQMGEVSNLKFLAHGFLNFISNSHEVFSRGFR